MARKRYLIEIKEEYLPRIVRRKKDFIDLLVLAGNDEEKKKDLSLRFGTVLILEGNGHEKVVINVEGDTLFRR